MSDRPKTRRSEPKPPLPGGGGVYAPDPDDQRYERKFTPERISVAELEILLKTHPSVFRMAYPDRYVNNLYLDSADLGCYREHVAGCARRVKYRIRWYGELHQSDAQPVLELKRKIGLVGSKLQFPLPRLDTRGGVDVDRLQALLARGDLDPALASRFESMRWVLGNRYRRSYLLSADGGFRLTIDRNLEFFPAVQVGDHRPEPIRDPSLILEMKYHRDLDVEAGAVTSHLPFRITRLSKYILGVQRLRAQGLGF